MEQNQVLATQRSVGERLPRSPRCPDCVEVGLLDQIGFDVNPPSPETESRTEPFQRMASRVRSPMASRSHLEPRGEMRRASA